MPKMRTAVVLSAVAALLLPLTACATDNSTSADQSTPRDTLVYATGDGEPSCLDPHVGGNFPQALLATQVLESLVSLDVNGMVVPWLAESWQLSDDGLNFDFTLRADARFSDGTPVDAAAVQANIAHLQDPETGSSTGYLALQQVDSVEVLSDNVVRMVLSRPDASLLESLAQPWNAIQSPAGIARGKDANCLAPIGSGPFMVDEWVTQDRITLSRNPEYVTTPAGLDAPTAESADTLIWRFIPDASARFAALQSGEVDIIDNPLPEHITAAENDSALAHLDGPRPGASNRIEFNTSQAPFNEQKVREALIAAADISSGLESLFEGWAPRSYSALSSQEPFAEQSPDSYTTDIERANKLLDEAGWVRDTADGIRSKDGVPLTVRFPVTSAQSTQAELALFQQIQAGALAAGFDVQIFPMDLSSWYGALAANEYEMVSAPYTKIGPDVLRFLYHSDATVPAPSGYFANLAQVQDPELDTLLTTLSTETDPAQREAAARAAQRFIAEKALILPIYDQQNHFVYRADLTGFRTLPTVQTPWLGAVTAG